MKSNQEVVGEGVTILLHGVPGVGKASTARRWHPSLHLLSNHHPDLGIANMNQNALQKQTISLCSPLPVVSIGCTCFIEQSQQRANRCIGDLGTSPREAEKRLEQLAQLWNYVLLLDENDIFLAILTSRTQRTPRSARFRTVAESAMRSKALLRWRDTVPVAAGSNLRGSILSGCPRCPTSSTTTSGASSQRLARQRPRDGATVSTNIAPMRRYTCNHSITTQTTAGRQKGLGMSCLGRWQRHPT